MATSSSLEFEQAHAELRNLGFGYLKSMALQCAINLGIPDAIHKLGGSASLADLLAAVPVPEHRKPYLPRLLRFLAATGIVSLDVPSSAADECAAAGDDEAPAASVYRLTPVSRLLVDGVDGRTSLSPLMLLQTSKYQVTASLHLSAWFEGEDAAAAAPAPAAAVETTTPFRMAYGADLWGAMRGDPQLSKVLNGGLASDSRLVLEFVVARCGEVFDGVASLVDVGGGTGGAARAIAKAFPHVKCSVLDLPNVISSIHPADDDTVEYVAGDMMDSIPPTDAVLLKYVLHDWDDEECVKILTQCKKAVCSRESGGGKVIIIDIIVGSSSKAMLEAQVSMDLLMMVMTGGKEREEHEWCKIFTDAGFGRYKARPVLGFLSIIELYP
ncbi:hypothetical protein ACP4OV_017763 [Aristida adscensionis]